MTLKELFVRQVTSGRFLSTVMLIATYCLIMLCGAIGCAILFYKGEYGIGEKLFVYIVGTLSGTAIGGVVAYHFKKEAQQNGGEK